MVFTLRYLSLLVFLLLSLTETINAQVVIKDKIELGKDTVNMFGKTNTEKEPFENYHYFIGEGGVVTLHMSLIDRYNFRDWTLYEETLGRIENVGKINNFNLGNIWQWTGFSFYLLNKNTGEKRYTGDLFNSSPVCNFRTRFAGNTSTADPKVYFKNSTGNFSGSMSIHLEPDSSLAAIPGERIMNCLERNFNNETGGTIFFENEEWGYAKIRTSQGTASYDLYLNSPEEKLLRSNAGNHTDKYFRLGPYAKSDSLNFYITSSHNLVQGKKMYGKKYGGGNKSISFEDWTDLNYNDVIIDISEGLMPSDPNYVVIDVLPYSTMYGDTAYVEFKGTTRTGYHKDFPKDQKFDVWIDEEDLEYGILVSKDGSQRGSQLKDVSQPVLFISKTTEELGSEPRFSSLLVHANTTLQSPYPPYKIEERPGRGRIRLRREVLKVEFDPFPVAPGQKTVVTPYFQYSDGDRQYFDEDHTFYLVYILKGREYGYLESRDGENLGSAENHVSPGFKFVANQNIDTDSAVVWIYVDTDITYDRPFIQSISTTKQEYPENNGDEKLEIHQEYSGQQLEFIKLLEHEKQHEMIKMLRSQNIVPENDFSFAQAEISASSFVIGYGRLLITQKDDLQINLEIPNPKEIWPTIPNDGARTEFDRSQVENTAEEILVTVTRDEEPVEGQPVTLTAEWIPGSGGHNHNGTRDLQQPPQELMGEFVENDEDPTAGVLQTTTNSDGEVRFQYIAPEFGGELKLVAKTLNAYNDTLSAEDSLTIRVPDLVLLSEGEHYEKVGGTPAHHGPRLDNLYQNNRTTDNNHYGTSAFVDSLVSIANAWHNLVSEDSTQDIRQTPLNINDMSLPYGGKFDIEGKFLDRASYHAFHRLGRDADIRTTRDFPLNPPARNGVFLNPLLDAEGNPETFPNGTVIYENSEFEELAVRKGASPLPRIHGTNNNEHYHVYFY